MAKKMLIDATHAEETRVVVVDGNKVEEFDFETENKRQLAGNIYLAKVSRVEPSLQAAFVEYGGNRHGFLAFSEIHPDYYQIPVADREALLAEERAYAAQQAAEEDEDKPKSRSRSRGGSRSKSKDKAEKAETAASDDAVESRDVSSDDIPGMGVVDLDDGDSAEDGPVGLTEDAPDGGAAAEADGPAPAAGNAQGDNGNAGRGENGQNAEQGDYDEPYAAVDHATELDSDIESVADEDVAEEIRQPRRAKPRKYKIQEVIKVRQILLVQVVKEERGNKGAALTTYLSLAGRYCVLMPNTARGGGISRKITNAADRKKLKEIATSIDVPLGAGLIVRTAGAKRTKSEIKRDYEYLQRLWEQIRALTLQSIAPAKIYEEGNLIKRSIRDLYNREIDEVLVEGEAGYRVAKDFMKMIMPSHAKNVKHYVDPMPLFARYQVESYLSSMFNPTVQLKSGGYIVIGVTEALVAIDVNSGRATKKGSIEETALETNLEAAEEISRQLRLRDLAGLIVIDFIDMEERKNNASVEKKFKDKLKTDRARIQVGRISGFGLLEMSRQRLRPGMLEATTQACPACHGTGLIRSDDNLALNILRQLEEEGTRRKSREVLLKAPVGIVNFLMNQKREHVAGIEARYGMSVRIEADPFLISPDFSIEKFKTASRPVTEASPVVSVDASLMPVEAEEEDEAPAQAEAQADAASGPPEGEEKPKKKRRRRRRRRGSGNGNGESGEQSTDQGQEADAKDTGDKDGTSEAPKAPEPAEAKADETAEGATPSEEEKPKKRRRTRTRSKKPAETTESQDQPADAEAKAAEGAAAQADETPAPETAEAPEAKAESTESAPEPAVEETAAPEAEAPEAEAAAPEAEAVPEPEAAAEAEPTEASTAKDAAPEEAAPAEAAEPEAETPQAATEDTAEDTPAPEPEPEAPAEDAEDSAEPEPAMAEAEETSKPKKRGWWSVGR
ncbi:ribonuclease E/G [Psychromarinibacter sp. C21-152]|uniref:Ribonuclease E n=1 Tax=Psychromarinibacter sediminicola TaxID=3033385 RepID=A0AAE3NQI4_9RHOB|nr:ribonuclease E/G [Psychromarinibacter sediminicola]MDF0602358.1 ribonuclease E/G [Psychromarinibacter sediminicola]